MNYGQPKIEENIDHDDLMYASYVEFDGLDEKLKDKVKKLVEIEGDKALQVFIDYYRIDHDLGIQALEILSRCSEKVTTDIILDLLSSIVFYINHLDKEFVNIKFDPKFQNEDEELKPREVIVKENIIPEVRRIILEKVGKALSNITNEDEVNTDEIIKHLKNINPHAIMVGAMLLTSQSKFENADMNEMPFLKLIEYEGDTTYINDPEFVKSLEDIYKINYADKPELLKKLLKSFENERNSRNAFFKVVELDGKPIAFCTFRFDEDQSIHFGKFNVHPDFVGIKLGEQILNETLDEYSITHVIKAECDRDTRVASKYLEKGFIAYKEYKLDEIMCWDIVRNDSMNKDLVTKSVDIDFIMKHIELGVWAPLNLTPDLEQTKVYAIEADKFKDNPLELLSSEKGYVITRMSREKTSDGKDEIVVIVAERIGENLEKYINEFKRPEVVQTRHSIIV